MMIYDNVRTWGIDPKDLKFFGRSDSHQSSPMKEIYFLVLILLLALDIFSPAGLADAYSVNRYIQTRCGFCDAVISAQNSSSNVTINAERKSANLLQRQESGRNKNHSVR